MMHYISHSTRPDNPTTNVVRVFSASDIGPDDLRKFFDKVLIGSDDECWIWTGALNKREPKGYGQFYLSATRGVPAHRVSYTIYKGDIPQDKLVCHSCDNRVCVNPNHLWVGDNSTNAIDSIKKGRHYFTKLTVAKVQGIKYLLHIGSPVKRIASIYGISEPLVSNIKKGNRWKFV